MKPQKLLIILPFLLIAILVLFNSYYMLDNAEEAVIERFGKLHTVNNTAGLHFKVPFIDRVRIIKTNEILSLQYGYLPELAPTTSQAATYRDVESEAIVLTSGSYLINIGAVIQYQISDPAAYLYNVDDPEGTIRLAFESVLRSNIQNQQLEEALINKDSIANEILPDMTRKLYSYGVGITIKDIKLTDVLLPSDVQFAYDDVNIASNEKDSFRSQSERYSNEMIPKARAEAYQMIQTAEAYRAEKVAQALGEVENFNQVFEKYQVAQEITRTRLYIETMETILSNVKDKYIIDIGDDNVLKFLPLNVKGGQ